MVNEAGGHNRFIAIRFVTYSPVRLSVELRARGSRIVLLSKELMWVFVLDEC